MQALAGNAAADGLTGVSVLAELPRDASGGVDRSRLRAPAGGTATPAPKERAPGQDILDRLRADWAEILGQDAIAAEDNFFDMGGHSILVLRSLTRIRDRWGVKLGVTDFYEAPTAAQLARTLAARLAPAGESAGGGSDRRIMRLRQEGEGHPLIAVNNFATALALSTAGTTPRAASCVRIFDGADRDMLDGLSFEEVAALCAKLIRKAQPEGPYLLYGNCVHGNLALEAARILQREGAEIAGLVMKDVWEPGYSARLAATPGVSRREKLHSVKTRLRSVREGEMSLSTMLGMYRAVRATGILQAARFLGLVERVGTSDMEADEKRFVSLISGLRNAYRPAPVDFPVLHVVTSISPKGRGFSPSIGWEDVVEPGKLKTIHIDRISIRGKRCAGVEMLARRVEDWLGEGQTDQ